MFKAIGNISKQAGIMDCLGTSDIHTEKVFSKNIDLLQKFINNILAEGKDKQGTSLLNLNNINTIKNKQLLRLNNLEKLIGDKYINILNDLH